MANNKTQAKNTDLGAEFLKSLVKARGHLEYSFKKVAAIEIAKNLDEETLETLESFSSRFARYSDLLIAKCFRFRMIAKDPAFRGSVIDIINGAEKYGWIDSAEDWKRIRELRNQAAHEYDPEEVIELYRELIALTPKLLQVNTNG